MANMGYCRFENTARDLRDCFDWLGEYESDELPDSERNAFKRLLHTAIDMLIDHAEDEIAYKVTAEKVQS